MNIIITITPKVKCKISYLIGSVKSDTFKDRVVQDNDNQNSYLSNTGEQSDTYLFKRNISLT